MATYSHESKMALFAECVPAACSKTDVLVEILRPCIILKMVRTGRVTTAAEPRATLEERRDATDSYGEILEGADWSRVTGLYVSNPVLGGPSRRFSNFPAAGLYRYELKAPLPENGKGTD